MENELNQKNCPYCDELIAVEAIKCKHCSTMLENAPSTVGVPRNFNAPENETSTKSQLAEKNSKPSYLWSILNPILFSYNCYVITNNICVQDGYIHVSLAVAINLCILIVYPNEFKSVTKSTNKKFSYGILLIATILGLVLGYSSFEREVKTAILQEWEKDPKCKGIKILKISLKNKSGQTYEGFVDALDGTTEFRMRVEVLKDKKSFTWKLLEDINDELGPQDSTVNQPTSTSSSAKIDSTDSLDSQLMQVAKIANIEMRYTIIDSADSLDSQLMQAAKIGNLESVKNLLASGADLNARDKNYFQPIHYAAESGHDKVVKLLIAAGANANALAPGIGDDWSKFIIQDHEKWFLPNGAGVNAAFLDIRRSDKGRTPIHLASAGGHVETIKLLISSDVDINRVDNNSHKPIYCAALSGHVEAMKLMINSGARADDAVNAAALGGHIEAMKWLLTSGVRVDQSAIFDASEGGHIEMIKLILEEGVKVDAKKIGGFQSIHVASYCGNIEAVKFLLASGAHVDSRTDDGFEPIHSAAEGGHIEVIKLLLASGAKADARTNDGSTAHSIAVNQGHKNLAAWLISQL